MYENTNYSLTGIPLASDVGRHQLFVLAMRCNETTSDVELLGAQNFEINVLSGENRSYCDKGVNFVVTEVSLAVNGTRLNSTQRIELYEWFITEFSLSDQSDSIYFKNELKPERRNTSGCEVLKTYVSNSSYSGPVLTISWLVGCHLSNVSETYKEPSEVILDYPVFAWRVLNGNDSTLCFLDVDKSTGMSSVHLDIIKSTGISTVHLDVIKSTGMSSVHLDVIKSTGISSVHLDVIKSTGISTVHLDVIKSTDMSSVHLDVIKSTGMSSVHLDVTKSTGMSSVHLDVTKSTGISTVHLDVIKSTDISSVHLDVIKSTDMSSVHSSSVVIRTTHSPMSASGTTKLVSSKISATSTYMLSSTRTNQQVLESTASLPSNPMNATENFSAVTHTTVRRIYFSSINQSTVILVKPSSVMTSTYLTQQANHSSFASQNKFITINSSARTNSLHMELATSTFDSVGNATTYAR